MKRSDKVIITCAITGGIHTPSMSRYLPITPAQIAAESVAAAEAGAAMIHLHARDPETGGLVMLGKTFKGLTDEMLAWQTARLLDLADPPVQIAADADRRQAYGVVRVRPELVVEVAFDGVQASRRYPGGLALRFARVLRFRPDKKAADADTIDAVRALWAGEP